MRFGYFTLTDNPPAYGAKRRNAHRFLLDVMEECLHAEQIGLNSIEIAQTRERRNDATRERARAHRDLRP